jgi:hypothetical protein
MDLIPRFNNNSIRGYVQKHIDRIEAAVIEYMKNRGEDFVTEARNQPSARPYYMDDTSNLRNSIGFYIYKGNTKIEEDFTEDGEGKSNADQMIGEMQRENNSFYLYGVAGMEYALKLESLGYNVITNQATKIITLLEGDFNSLESKLS